MPRFFNLLEAESLLPQVERLVENLKRSKAQFDQVNTDLNQIVQRIMFAGGMIAPRDEIAALHKKKDTSARGLKASVEEIEEIGCQLKDVETGLIDFPTLYRGQEVYLCWKLGEKNITFWHHVEDGFRGRRPVDSDFLANHSGDPKG